MKSKTRLDSVVFQLTPTRTRCDLYIIANDKKEKIASGLVNPFIAHLKTAQDQIAEGGYSVLLQPEAGTDATWFTKCTVESFVRFVSTPEILERVYTIESEILQIDEAIAIQGNNYILIEDQHINPTASNEGNKPACDADDDKAIVLYKPGAHETTGSIDKEGNSKVQLLNVLETRKTVLKKEQGMAFARAVAAGFEMDHVANLLSFAESFGASRLMNACLRFMDLWKQKHESGQWVEIPAEDAINASGNGRHIQPNAISETKSNNEISGQLGQFPHPVFAPWGPGGVPVYQPYPMHPYYYPGNGPLYPSMEDPGGQKKRQSLESESVNEEDSKKSGRVVIKNINFVNSKRQNSESDTGSDENETDEYKRRSLKKKSNLKKQSDSETLNGKKEAVDSSSHWQAFQSYLLKGAEEDENMFAMERDPQKKRSMTDDPLAHGERCNYGESHQLDLQSFDKNGRKIVNRSGNDDFMVGGRLQSNTGNSSDPHSYIGFEGANDRKTNLDEAMMVSMRSTSDVNDNRSSINMDYELPPSSGQNQESNTFEPNDLNLMPERGGLEKMRYDPALDYEMQVSASHEKKSNQSDVVKKVSKKSAEKQQQSKATNSIRKGKPSKPSPAEDARARAEKLRSYKAELQKMKKEQQDADHRRLEALKMERQKRIAARGNSIPTRKQQLGGSKFTDSEPKSSSPLQRSKIKTISTNAKKPSTNSKSVDSAGTNNRLTRSMSDAKKEITSVDSKATRIRRLSEPKKINNTSHAFTKIATQPKSSNESKKVSAIDKTKAATLPELKIKTSKLSLTQKIPSGGNKETGAVKVKVKDTKLNNFNERLNDAADDNNPIVNVVDKTVMLEHKQKPSIITKEFDHGMEIVDKGTISIQPPISSEVKKSMELGEEESYQAPYARVSSFEDPSTRNSEYAKAPPQKSSFSTTTEKAFISDFNNLKLEKIPEVLDKPQVKGFRRLLKLGKKTHITSSDTTANEPDASDSGQAVQTLKTLISEDETPSQNQKSSKHFSLLSPFRGKTKATQ